MPLVLLGGVALAVFIMFLVHEVRVEGPKRARHYRELEQSGRLFRKM